MAIHLSNTDKAVSHVFQKKKLLPGRHLIPLVIAAVFRMNLPFFSISTLAELDGGFRSENCVGGVQLGA